MYDQTVKRFTHILLASQLVVFSVLYMNTIEGPVKLKKLLPKEINTITFGTSMDDILEIRPNAKVQDQQMEFRHVYLEEVNADNITSVVYYFDADLPGAPLYEMIVNFKDEATMELQANILLGTSNYTGKEGNAKEWKFEIKKETYPVHCWTFKNKIIYAMPILGTEWNDNGDIGL